MLARVLERHGMAVRIAASAAEALAGLDAPGEDVDVLVADMALPDATGIELARQAIAHWPQARVLLLSGQGDAPPPGLGRVGAPVRFLAKPFSGEQLAALLRELTG
jgi:DNA-binding response OmpR family regulator